MGCSAAKPEPRRAQDEPEAYEDDPADYVDAEGGDDAFSPLLCSFLDPEEVQGREAGRPYFGGLVLGTLRSFSAVSTAKDILLFFLKRR